MRVFDVYGMQVETLALAVEELSCRLNLEFEERESSYIGVYAKARSDGDGTVTVQPNMPPDDDGLLEEGVPECRFVVYASELSDPDGVRQCLEESEGVKFVRRTERA